MPSERPLRRLTRRSPELLLGRGANGSPSVAPPLAWPWPSLQRWLPPTSSQIGAQPYRPARREDQALAEIRSFAGTYYDPTVVNAFVAMVEARGG